MTIAVLAPFFGSMRRYCLRVRGVVATPHVEVKGSMIIFDKRLHKRLVFATRSVTRKAGTGPPGAGPATRTRGAARGP